LITKVAKSETYSDTVPLTADARQQILAWNLKTLVQAYEEVGHTNAAWDKAAEAALTAFAYSRAHIEETNGTARETILKHVAEAERAGCDDPLIRYVRLRTAPMDRYDEQFMQYVAVATNLQKSAYPSIRKFYADARALSHLDGYDKHASPGIKPIRSKVLGLLINDLEATLHDKNMPVREAYEVANQTMTLMESEKWNYKNAYGWIHAFFENWGDDYTASLLKGKAYIKMAWIARGNDYADKVTEEGWKNFKADLEVARSALEHAWILNSQDVEIPDAMMKVVLGEEGKMPDLDLWFDRAMNLNTNNFTACSAKLYYLEPKWYGSDEQQIAFGRRCATSVKWGGRVPLILVEAHRLINSRNAEALQADYWKKPSVWPDIQLAYDRFFELNPEDKETYQYYASYAYKAEQWNKLNELLPRLNNLNINYEIFRGAADGITEYQKMVRLAKEHAGSKK
jgi:hypothetical protein